jgi:hypothetical protein
LLVIDTEARLYVGPEVFDDHVNLIGQPFEHSQSFGRLQVQRDATLIAVQVLEVGAGTRAADAIALVRAFG